MKILAETERLILRELHPQDAEAMFVLDSDPEVHLFLGNCPVTTLQQSEDYIEEVLQQYRENGVGRLAVVEKYSNEVIGWAGLKLIRELTNNHINYYDVGYRLIKKYWGKGYATEAALASIDYGFNTLNLDALYAIADVDHTASLHVLKKAGLKPLEIFEYDGTPHQWMKIERSQFHLKS